MEEFIMKKIRLISMLMAISLVAASFAGCADKADSESSKVESTDTGEDSGKKEVVTLKMIGQTQKIDPMKELERQRILDLLGYEIDAEIGADADKINLILSSGQEYDILKADDKLVLSQIIANKSAQSLTKSIDQYGQNLKKIFEQKVWDMTADSEGNIYALLNTQYEATTDLLAVREDWLKALDMPAPTTPNEFYTMLKAFKEKNPMKVANVIPFSFTLNKTLGINGLTQAFGGSSSPLQFTELDGKLLFGLEIPETKEYLLFLRKLYEEGLLDADFAVNTGATFEEKIGTGSVGSLAGNCWQSSAQQAVNKLSPEAKLTFIPPLKDKNGNQKNLTTGGMETFIVVPHTSKKVDDVIKYANAFVAEENYSKLVIGDENVHWEEKDGKRVPIMPAFNDMNMARWFFPANETSIYTPIFGVRAWKVKEMGEMWDQTTTLGKDTGYLDPLAYAPALEDVLKIEKKVLDYANEQLINFIIDPTIPESNYEKIVEEFMKMGGDQYVKAYKDWFQAQ